MRLPLPTPMEPREIFGSSTRGLRWANDRGPLDDAHRLLARKSSRGPSVASSEAQTLSPLLGWSTDASYNRLYQPMTPYASAVSRSQEQSNPPRQDARKLCSKPRQASSSNEGPVSVCSADDSLTGEQRTNSVKTESDGGQPSPIATGSLECRMLTFWSSLSPRELLGHLEEKRLDRPSVPILPDHADFEQRAQKCTACQGTGKDKHQVTTECKACGGEGKVIEIRHSAAERERRAKHKYFIDLMHRDLPDCILLESGHQQKAGPTKEQVLEGTVLYMQLLKMAHHLQGFTLPDHQQGTRRSSSASQELAETLERQIRDRNAIIAIQRNHIEGMENQQSRCHCTKRTQPSGPHKLRRDVSDAEMPHATSSPNKRRRFSYELYNQDSAADARLEKVHDCSGTTLDEESVQEDVDEPTPTRFAVHRGGAPSPMSATTSFSDTGSFASTSSSWNEVSPKATA